MDFIKITFYLYLFLACYCAGSMTVLQLQHFCLYRYVGADAFKNYINANNKAAWLPTILPGLLLLICTIILTASRPPFMYADSAVYSLILNLVNVASIIIWQGKLHRQLAQNGFDAQKIKLLNATNWISTLALLVQAIVAIAVIVETIG